MSFALRVSLLAFLSIIFLGRVSLTEPYIFSLTIVAGVIGLITVVVHLRVAAFIFGLSICTLPYLSGGSLGLFVSCWLIGFEISRFFFKPGLALTWTGKKKAAWFGFLLFLALCLGGTIGAALSTFDWWLLNTQLRFGGLKGAITFLQVANPVWFRALFELAGWITAILVVFTLLAISDFLKESGKGVLWKPVVLGLAIGSLVCVLVLLAQVNQVSPFSEFHRVAYWQSLNRHSGTFSDPNSFGIMAALLIPLFVFYRGPRKNLSLFAALCLLLTVAWSGSRSFWLGLFLFLLAQVTAALYMRIRAVGTVVVLFCLVGVIILCGKPDINETLQRFSPAEGITRTLNTINWAKWDEMLESKQIFTKLSLNVWKTHPIFGVGDSQFVEVQGEVAKNLGIELGSYRDNANNFYLEVLAERGIVGLFVTVISLILIAYGISNRNLLLEMELAWEISLRKVARLLLGILLVLLMTGPHTSFLEVRYLSAVLIAIALGGYVLSERTQELKIGRVELSVLVIIPLLFCLVASRDYFKRNKFGLYPAESVGPAESGGEGVFYWTGERAQFGVCTGDDGVGAFEVRTLEPGVEGRPVRVKVAVKASGGEFVVIEETELGSNSWHRLNIKGKIGSEGRALARISLDRAWSPKASGVSDDPRWLGVMVKGVCLLD